MAKSVEEYTYIIVESYVETATSGLHGNVHIRPIEGQGYPTTLRVQCSNKLKTDFKIGTRFRIKVRTSDRDGGGEFLTSYHGWKFEVLS